MSAEVLTTVEREALEQLVALLDAMPVTDSDCCVPALRKLLDALPADRQVTVSGLVKSLTSSKPGWVVVTVMEPNGDEDRVRWLQWDAPIESAPATGSMVSVDVVEQVRPRATVTVVTPKVPS